MSTTQPQGEAQNVGITAEQRQHRIATESQRLSDAAFRISTWSVIGVDNPAAATTRDLIEDEMKFIEGVISRLREVIAAPLA